MLPDEIKDNNTGANSQAMGSESPEFTITLQPPQEVALNGANTNGVVKQEDLPLLTHSKTEPITQPAQEKKEPAGQATIRVGNVDYTITTKSATAPNNGPERNLDKKATLDEIAAYAAEVLRAKEDLGSRNDDIIRRGGSGHPLQKTTDKYT